MAPPVARHEPTLLWCREATELILARASVGWTALASGEQLKRFKGSTEGSTALALKAAVARWLKLSSPDATLRFEQTAVECVEQDGATVVTRVDLSVEGLGRFEVETMSGSGPMEAFVRGKVFSRLRAGGTPLGPDRIEIEVPIDELALDGGPGAVSKTWPQGEEGLRLTDVAGCRRLRESSGILFFGPPGCGKSRLVRAIAGELDQEVRLLGPADLRGPTPVNMRRYSIVTSLVT
jgi:ABC-type uncharacterized transport system fused permease/ATPase subunit